LSNTTSNDPPGSAGAITWLFVMMYPFERITSPEPTPPPLGLWAMIVTTAGSCCSATEVTLHDGPVASAVLVATAVVVLVVDLFVIRPTTTAAASTTITPIASGRTKRVRREPGEDTEPAKLLRPIAARQIGMHASVGEGVSPPASARARIDAGAARSRQQHGSVVGLQDAAGDRAQQERADAGALTLTHRDQKRPLRLGGRGNYLGRLALGDHRQPTGLEPCLASYPHALLHQRLGVGGAHDRGIWAGQSAQDASRRLGGDMGEQHGGPMSLPDDCRGAFDGAGGALRAIPADQHRPIVLGVRRIGSRSRLAGPDQDHGSMFSTEDIACTEPRRYLLI